MLSVSFIAEIAQHASNNHPALSHKARFLSGTSAIISILLLRGTIFSAQRSEGMVDNSGAVEASAQPQVSIAQVSDGVLSLYYFIAVLGSVQRLEAVSVGTVTWQRAALQVGQFLLFSLELLFQWPIANSQIAFLIPPLLLFGAFSAYVSDEQSNKSYFTFSSPEGSKRQSQPMPGGRKHSEVEGRAINVSEKVVSPYFNNRALPPAPPVIEPSQRLQTDQISIQELLKKQTSEKIGKPQQ